MREQLLVLTGGPGTGKTYTVKQIVEGWRRRGKRVVLACPTARAATVLASTVRSPYPNPSAVTAPYRPTALPPSLSMSAAPPPDPIPEPTPKPGPDPKPGPNPTPGPSLKQVGSPASTIHRLLEYNPQEDMYKRNQLRPLEADAIVVDEASMLGPNPNRNPLTRNP